MSKTMAEEPDYQSWSPGPVTYGYRSLQEDTAYVRLHQKTWISEIKSLQCYGYWSVILFVVCTLLLISMSIVGMVMSLVQIESMKKLTSHELTTSGVWEVSNTTAPSLVVYKQ